ncbi:MAG: hypothetical protein U1F34_05685 [Gammaproteobacteria bacterium]
MLAALSLPVAGILSLVGGALFGFGVGIILVMVSVFLRRGLLERICRVTCYVVGSCSALKTIWLEYKPEGIRARRKFYLFAMRMTPQVVPYFVLNQSCGAHRDTSRQFIGVKQVNGAGDDHSGVCRHTIREHSIATSGFRSGLVSGFVSNGIDAAGRADGVRLDQR